MYNWTFKKTVIYVLLLTAFYIMGTMAGFVGFDKIAEWIEKKKTK